MTGMTWACLIRIKNTEGLRSHVIDKPSFIIGRAQEADLPILESTISRAHLAIQINPDSIWIADQRSANGTYLNGKQLQPGQAIQVKPSDIVKFGTLADEFTFMAIPKPFELMGTAGQKNAVLASMEEHAKQLETKLRSELEKELRQARLEVDQVRAESKREVESIRSQAAEELQSRKADLEAEIAKTRQSAQLNVSEEKVQARKEADLLVSEAQAKIQKDFEAASAKIAEQFQAAQDKCRKLVEDADEKALRMLNEAREEAVKIRVDASENAKQVHQEALRKSTEAIDTAHKRLTRELEEKRQHAFEQMKTEISEEKERFAKEHAAYKDALRVQITGLEKTRNELAREVDLTETQFKAIGKEFESIRSDFEIAKKLVAEARDVDARRAQAEKELKEFVHRRESGLSVLEKEMLDARQRYTVELEGKKREQEECLAQDRLRAMKEIEQTVKAEEKKYEQTRMLRAVELTQKLKERLVPKLSEWTRNPEAAKARMFDEISEAVRSSMEFSGISVQSGSADKVSPSIAQGQTDKRILKYGAIAGAAIALAVVFFRNDIYSSMMDSQKDSYAAKLIEKRRIQSIYTPVQTEEFRDSYAENVTYKRGYFELKTDPATIEKWTLRLNNIAFLKPLGLSEENIVRFIAKETNLVQRLGVLRASIDAVYLNEGLERMRNAEAEDMAEILAALKGEANYKKIRALEKEFLAKLSH